jgi:hypothetical protein
MNMEVVVSMGQANLDTEEVDGSSPFGPTIYLMESAPSRAAASLRVAPTRHHWSPNPKGFRLPCAVLREWPRGRIRAPLKGIASKMGYLHSPGVDAIWITPCFPSPQVDFGHDVSDSENIEPPRQGCIFFRLDADWGVRENTRCQNSRCWCWTMSRSSASV